MLGQRVPRRQGIAQCVGRSVGEGGPPSDPREAPVGRANGVEPLLLSSQGYELGYRDGYEGYYYARDGHHGRDRYNGDRIYELPRYR